MGSCCVFVLSLSQSINQSMKSTTTTTTTTTVVVLIAMLAVASAGQIKSKTAKEETLSKKGKKLDKHDYKDLPDAPSEWLDIPTNEPLAREHLRCSGCKLSVKVMAQFVKDFENEEKRKAEEIDISERMDAACERIMGDTVLPPWTPKTAAMGRLPDYVYLPYRENPDEEIEALPQDEYDAFLRNACYRVIEEGEEAFSEHYTGTHEKLVEEVCKKTLGFCKTDVAFVNQNEMNKQQQQKAAAEAAAKKKAESWAPEVEL